MHPDRIHLKTRKGPETDRKRKAFISTTVNLMNEVGGLSNKAKLKLAARRAAKGGAA